jgi:two-component system CheB/CheR fusion protein
LALARQIAELHGGAIEAASAGIGKGACFRLRLPPGDIHGKEGKHGPGGAAHALRNLRILLVDDDTEALESFKYLLEFEGAKVCTASSGEEGLALLKEREIDLILSDLAMPGMDGYSFVQQMRRQTGGKPAVIAISGLGRAQDAERALQMGFSAHLTKPVSIDTLRETVARLMLEEKV